MNFGTFNGYMLKLINFVSTVTCGCIQIIFMHPECDKGLEHHSFAMCCTENLFVVKLV
jgi:hypothetical protein